MGFGFGEIVLISSIVILLFGAKRLPQLGSSLGKAITNFKSGLHDKKETKDLEE